jgi:hypothetical protein
MMSPQPAPSPPSSVFHSVWLHLCTHMQVLLRSEEHGMGQQHSTWGALTAVRLRGLCVGFMDVKGTVWAPMPMVAALSVLSGPLTAGRVPVLS